MRVLHFIPSFGSGGAERQLALLAPALQARGLEVHVAHAALGPNYRTIAESAVRLHRLHAANSHDLRLLWQALALIRQVRPDIVHTWLLQMDVFGGCAALLLHKPFIMSERSSAGAYPPHWKHRVRVHLGRRADAIVANSEGGLAYWHAQGTRAALHLIRNGIAPPRAARALPAAAGADGLIVYAGRLSPEKNVLRLLDAFVEVARQRPGVAIRMFGDGPLQGTLAQRLAASGQAGRIQLCGFADDLADWMRAATLCVSVSDFEGHPNVVLEAASLGCPLLLSDIPAHREVLGDGDTAFVDAGSADAIARALLQLLDQPDAARRRAERARQSVGRFTLDAIAEAYVDAYHAVLASPRP